MSEDPRATIEYMRMRYGVFSWQGQALQYDQVGPPGEIVFRVFIDNGVAINTLLYYDPEVKLLAGILNHYPRGAQRWDGAWLERPGNVNVFVHPDADDSEAVYAKLMAEATRRWPDLIAPVQWEVPAPVGGYLDGNRRIWRSSTLNR